jgi:hypothetical protein
MTDQNLTELLKLGFQHVGDFFLEGNKLRFFLKNHKNDAGSYAFVVNEAVKYVGTTKNTLYARMNGYKNPGPSQKTNKRVKPKITEARKVQIYFLPDSDISNFVTVIRRERIEYEIPTDASTLERFLISLFRPEWNRQ